FCTFPRSIMFCVRFASSITWLTSAGDWYDVGLHKNSRFCVQHAALSPVRPRRATVPAMSEQIAPADCTNEYAQTFAVGGAPVVGFALHGGGDGRVSGGCARHVSTSWPAPNDACSPSPGKCVTVSGFLSESPALEPVPMRIVACSPHL